MASERPLSAHAGSTARTAGIILMSVVFCSVMAGQISGASPENPTNAKPAAAALLAVPLSFEANQGQTDSQVKFQSRGDGYSLFLTSNEVVFTLRTRAGVKAPPSVFRMELRGAERNAQVSGADKLPGVANYFIGNDPKKWRSGITTYGKVKYQGIYPGIDAVFYGNQRQLEYDFVVAPGADPKQISLGLTGTKPSLDADGNVALKLADGDLALKRPVVYQNVAGEKKIVEARYIIAGNKVRFHLGKYDHNQTLVIDPVFTYLTYLGGSSVDYIGGMTAVAQTGSPNQALAIDSAGDVYVTGQTISNDFPVANAYQSTRNEPGGAYTAFVSALNPTGTALLYSTYLGGSTAPGGFAGSDIGASIVWDNFDNAVYVVGTTTSVDFPTTPGAFQKVLSGNFTAFVAKFNNAGQLTKSTFLGAPVTYGLGVATDSQGRAYVVGFTSYNCTPNGSTCPFPTTPRPVIPTPPSSFNGYGFVSVLDTNLSTLLYSTLLGDPSAAPAGGGATISEAFGVTVDPNGNFYVVGVTSSPSLPTTAGAFQPTIGVANSIPPAGFAAKFGPVSATGASLTYLTYLEATGESFGDLPGGVAADSQGNAYVGGYTNSPTFPVTTGAYNTGCFLNGARLCPAAFVTKLNPAGTGLVWSALVEPADFFSAIQLDKQGNVYVAGHNASGNSFVPVNPVQPSLNNGGGFVAELDPTGSTLLFSSLIQGGFTMQGLAVDAQESIYVASYTYDTTLPTTPGAFQTALKNPGTGNSYDGFIAKITPTAGPVLQAGTLANGATYIAGGLVPGSWAQVKGTNLSTTTRTWAASDFTGLGNGLPTNLSGVQVNVNNQPAAVYYISPTQVSFQVPAGITGSASVQVIANGQTSNSVTAPAETSSPGIFPLILGGTNYAAAVFLDGKIAADPSNGPGFRDAVPGDTVQLFVTGLAPSPAGTLVSTTLLSGVTVTIGGVTIPAEATALVTVGEFQINFAVPQSFASLPAGQYPISISIDGVSSPASINSAPPGPVVFPIQP
jgi:uncharacterized protein (TIGR03437 family)